MGMVVLVMVVAALLVEGDQVVMVVEPGPDVVVGSVVLGGDRDVTAAVLVAGLVQFPEHAVVLSRGTVWVALGCAGARVAEVLVGVVGSVPMVLLSMGVGVVLISMRVVLL